MMNDYNRSNPFMVLLESKQTQLIQQTEISIKRAIVLGIGFIIYLIIFISYNVIVNYNYFELFIFGGIIAQIYFSVNEIIQCTKKSKTHEVNEMIFSDKYRDINLNNEKLLFQISDYDHAIGRISLLADYINLQFIVIMIFLIKYILQIFIYIFS